MKTLIDFAIRAEYARIKALGDELCEMGSQIDWERFRFLEPLMYKNKSSRGGRPNIDFAIMIKLLVLQHWFGLSDPELERQVADRISFRIFLDTTEVVLSMAKRKSPIMAMKFPQVYLRLFHFAAPAE